jgi:3-oxoacyl-[acyl-carrier protein] reductase
MGKLQGKVALVTGSGRGIGKSIALKLAAEGACVVVNDLDADTAEATLEEIVKAGGAAIAVSGSVTDADFADRYVGAAMERWGDLHIIVNNAGYTWDSVIHKMSDDQFDAMLDVHLRGSFRILRAAAEPFRILSRRDAEAGREIVRKVVNISSTSGTGGNPGQVNYAAAKAGLIGMTKTLAKEWGRYRVAVNCVAFGYIQTRLTEATSAAKNVIEVAGRNIPIGMPEAAVGALNRVIPLGRGGTPEEAAGSVYLFCIPESDYVTGQVLVCGGGIGSVA